MQKATPIESLPNVGGQQNQGSVQMTMIPEHPHGGPGSSPQPPQPYSGKRAGNQMHQDMGMEREGHRLNDQEKFMNRQFVPSSRTGSPSDMYDPPPRQMGDNYSCQLPQPVQRAGGIIKERNLWHQLMAHSKVLLLVVVLLFVSQLQIVQNLFRTFSRTVKVPDTMVFTVSKLLVSLVGTVVFFVVLRNM